MKLSAPAYHLKRTAKSLSRQENIPLHAALDKVANQQGFDNWSLLANHIKPTCKTTRMLKALSPGELVLIAARPGQGKTTLGIDLVAKSSLFNAEGWFFTLEWNQTDVEEILNSLGERSISASEHFHFDGSESISADYIAQQLESSRPGTIAVIDYLQLLDQKRTNPPLTDQVTALKSLACEQKLIIICVSQVHRSFDTTNKAMPTLEDIRLPNPLDLSLFNKAYFLHSGRIEPQIKGKGSSLKCGR